MNKGDLKILKNKIKEKSLKICVLGQGYIGLPLSLTFSEAGWDVCGFDNDKEKIKNEAKKYLDIFKDSPYIFNLGHGVMPDTKPEMVDYLVKFVKNY